MATLIDILLVKKTKVGRILFISKPPLPKFWGRVKDVFGVLTGRYEAVKFAEEECRRNHKWIDAFPVLNDAEVKAVEDSAIKSLISQITKGVPRNEKCPCGSGKKFKKCCGRNLKK